MQNTQNEGSEKTSNAFVAYYRVSTTKQGQSGLGLDAQKSAVANYLARETQVISREFLEIESGRKADRPELNRAIAYCRKNKATLLIAKLDRLARNVHFISGLMESGIRFVAIDMPNADRFMLHVYAAMAEEEARRISQRTKVALAAAKARGTQLGKNATNLAKINIAAAEQIAIDIGPKIQFLRNTKKFSFRRIADQLNSENVSTYRNARWHATSVWRIFSRFEQMRNLTAN